MERLGVVGIYKEAAGLLHKHRRLFMPFVLAIYLPASLLSVFESVILVPASTHLFNAFIHSAAQEAGDRTDKGQLSPTLVYSLIALGVIIGSLGLAANAYIVDYIYSGGDTDDDSIVRKVFKLLPRAFFRIFVTQLWLLLALYLLLVACVVLATILNVTLAAITGADPTVPTPALFLFFYVPFAIGLVVAVVMFALMDLVAVLEPEKYGREALRQSVRYVRGRAWTVFRILSLATVFGRLIHAGPARGVAEADLPSWVKIVLTVALSCLVSVIFAFLGTVQVVTYFVCKSSSEAVLPVFQRDGAGTGAAPTAEAPLLGGSAQRKSATDRRSGVDT